MPIFDTKCEVCGAIAQDVVHRADETPPRCSCGGATTHVFLIAPRTHIFRKGWYEHLAPEPKYFDDRGTLREYCKRNDLYMEQLE